MIAGANGTGPDAAGAGSDGAGAAALEREFLSVLEAIVERDPWFAHYRLSRIAAECRALASGAGAAGAPAETLDLMAALSGDLEALLTGPRLRTREILPLLERGFAVAGRLAALRAVAPADGTS